MNDLLTGLYESWFDYNLHQGLIESVFRANDFGFIGWITIGMTLVCLFIFYKFWDPVEGQRRKWITILLINSILIFGISCLVLYNNQGLIEAMGEFTDGEGVNPHYFILKIAGITSLYALVLALIFCLTPLPVKYFSNDNKHNPF